ncbi:MAG: tRNA (adenosine(37)-N6)-dimethylallyltransferase MiaA [Pseudomonadota bacterium]|nr:tRNA (adenosine(37)-N6)-dimethylallyltransferase MiaA [Pseudomonadota bacterium]
MVTKSLPPVALIAGPTASGKSAVALALAEARDGVIVNADSAQLYRDLPILSAAPSPGDRQRAEHRLYGVRDGADPCSAAAWADLARREISAIHAEGRLPILVGGTGLYLRTLLDGIAPVPAIDPAIRAEVRAASVADNFAALTPLDPLAAARLNPGDSTRIARALEVVRSSGRTLAEWQENRSGGIGDAIALGPLILLPPREWLGERCDRRFGEMVDQGALGEVEALLARKLDPDLPVMRAIGVRELASLLEGTATREQAVAAGQIATRQYAKRQYTWFARQPPSDWPRWTEALDDPARALALFEGTR